MKQKISRITNQTVEKISKTYEMGLRKAMRLNAVTLRRMREIMDGNAKPPFYCVTDAMKTRWKRKTLLKLMKDSHIVEKMNDCLMECGDDAVLEIQKMGLEIYETAYNAIAGDVA